MCKFENDFLLCSCNDDLQESDIDWVLKRRSKKQPIRSYKIIGQINIPEEFKNISQEEYDAKIDEMIKFSELHKLRKIELKNTIINIQFELNNRKCFDTELTFLENDILSIRLDVALKVWADFVYQKSFWKISDVVIGKYDHVNKGKINQLNT
ncbi:hypothetical protein [uncultured Kordia sp.]|uniref:hypothetical protein n=1 Tax=uncultured Kordia sp. TaxID=507699 RepID=UPI00261D0D93|nr:hypothetical protein [uncultured Kordia sp.]